MDVLIFGGTRFFGRQLVPALLRRGHRVTIAARGHARNDFGSPVERIVTERADGDCLRRAVCPLDAVCDATAALTPPTTCAGC